MIRIEQLCFSVGAFALRDVPLHVRPGEYFVLLGPTGSGKTLLVESICGLNRPSAGRIFIDGTDVTGLEPRDRRLGYLPQDYALFPHRTVRQNVGFGLRRRDVPRETAQRRVEQLMTQLGVAHLADRLPTKLSGGEKQRVALARALAVRPKVLLLDEPVSALDEQTRDALCRLLKQLQRDTGTTTLHVCHNFAEMLSVADRVAVIDQGRILQVGTPREVLQRPCATMVARFVQAGNLLAARASLDGEGIRLACGGNIELLACRSDSAPQAGEVTVMVRPENIRLLATPPNARPPRTTLLAGVVRHVVDLGPVAKLSVACGTDAELLVSMGKREYNDFFLEVGQQVCLLIAMEDVHVMSR